MKRLLALAAALLVAGCGGPDAPVERAATFVPADALLYLHLSTDPERGQDKRLLATLSKFPGARGLVARLGESFAYERDVRPWLGDEAAVAFLDTGTPRADVLIAAAVKDRPKAEGFLTRIAGPKPALQWRGVVIRRFGDLTAGFVNGFLVAGQLAAVKEAIDTAKGHRPALAGDRVYKRVTAGWPDGRSGDLWASTQGVRRVLRPLPGFGGALGALLDHPRLQGVGAALSAEEQGIRVHLRAARPPGRQFEPKLFDRVPKDAAAYLGIGDLEPLLRALPKRLGDVDIDRAALAGLREVTISLRPDLPAPVVTLLARTTDERRLRDALARLQQPIANALLGSGVVGEFQERDIDGVDAFVLPVSTAFQLSYAVHDGLLVISTQPKGIEDAQGGNEPLADADRFKSAVGETPEKAEALAFADLSQLLALGDQTGLTGIPAIQSVQDDLRRIRAAGAVVGREGPDTTAELFFEIP